MKFRPGVVPQCPSRRGLMSVEGRAARAERIVKQIDLPDRQIVGRAPVGVDSRRVQLRAMARKRRHQPPRRVYPMADLPGTRPRCGGDRLAIKQPTPRQVPDLTEITRHSSDPGGFAANIALLTGFDSGKSLSLRARGDCTARGFWNRIEAYAA